MGWKCLGWWASGWWMSLWWTSHNPMGHKILLYFSVLIYSHPVSNYWFDSYWIERKLHNFVLSILPSCWKHFHKVVPQTCGKFSNSAFPGWYLHPSVWCPLQTSAQSLVHFIFLEESWFLQLYQVSSLIKPFHFIRRAAPSPENLKFSSWFLQRLPPLSLLSTFLLPKLWSCTNRAFDPPMLT